MSISVVNLAYVNNYFNNDCFASAVNLSNLGSLVTYFRSKTESWNASAIGCGDGSKGAALLGREITSNRFGHAKIRDRYQRARK